MRSVLKSVLLPAIAALSLVLIACSGSDRAVREIKRRVTPAPFITELNANREKWASSAIDDYRFTVRIDCLCPEYGDTYTFQVADGVRMRMISDSGKVITKSESAYEEWTGLATLEDLFSQVEEYLGRPKDYGLGPDNVTVRYNPQFGYPAIVDRPEWHLYVTDFEQQ